MTQLPEPTAKTPYHRLPMDMDVAAPDRLASLRKLLPSVAAVAAGGALGAAARYGVERAWPARPDGFPWATFGINVAGCVVMGVVVMLFMEIRPAPPLVRPFLATGFLGGFTTLSTYAADTERVARLGSPGTALAYYAGTLLAGLAGTWCASKLTWRIAARARRTTEAA